MSWNAFLKEKLKQRHYMYRKKAKKDILSALNAYKGLGVNECIYDGKRVMEASHPLVCLTGTIPVTYNNSINNISIRIVLMKRYPDVPPDVYMIPTIESNLRASRYIDDEGKVHIPMITGWQQASKPNIISVIEQMQHIFGQHYHGSKQSTGKLYAIEAPISSLWETFLNQCLHESQYQYHQEVKEEVVAALERYGSLKPSYEEYITNDNVRAKFLLCLRGTIPVHLSDITYNIPVEIWILPAHPYQDPIAYVKPTSNMVLNPTMCVDSIGRITLPQQSNWRNSAGMSLTSLIGKLITTFQNEIPIFTRRMDSPPQQVHFEVHRGDNTLYPNIQASLNTNQPNHVGKPFADQPSDVKSHHYNRVEKHETPLPTYTKTQYKPTTVQFTGIDKEAVQLTMNMNLSRADLVTALS